MTTTTNTPSSSAGAGSQVARPPEDLVNLTIDGVAVAVPKGTLVIRAAEHIGVQIPRFCDHPLLDPVGACRQCLVEVATPGPDGSMRAMPKPQASCTIAVSEGMEVKSQLTSAVADKAQHGIMEFLLINHPLDCPVCDKGGECPLQNQALSNGRVSSRFEDIKRTYPKPINISSQVLLDRERCVLCARCTRFSEQIAGDPFIALVERGALQQVGIYEEQPFESYFSGNTVQICPVGALTGAAYRFRSRPFDLVSTPTTCEHCASGCALRTDHRRGTVLRRMAGNDPDVNEEWNCDKGRWAFRYAHTGDRFELPMVRGANGDLEVASWPQALAAAADGLRAARTAGVLVGGRVSAEDAYAYGKFARSVLQTNDVDFRARPHTVEEEQFLAHRVAGTSPEHGAVSYADLETARTVVLVGLEPEEESPIVFLRLRKGVRKHGTVVYAVAPLATRGLDKLSGRLIPSAPGTETEVLEALAARGETGVLGEAAAALADEDAVVLVGERLAEVPGALSAASALATRTGAHLAWVPRRAGERGALEAGALPSLLPGGRPAADPAARDEVAAAWGVDQIASGMGRDTAAMVEAAAGGDLDALVVAGVDLDDLALPQAAAAAERAFVVSLEVRPSSVTQYADVILPVAPHAEKSGTFLDWEGRARPYSAALQTQSMSDYRVLDMLASHMGDVLGCRTLAEVRLEMERLGRWAGPRVDPPSAATSEVPSLGEGQFVLATWHHLLDRGSMQDGEPFLAGTAPQTSALISPSGATQIGVDDDDLVVVTGSDGSITVPVKVVDMVDYVVWLPTNSAGSPTRARGLRSGSVVSVTKGGAA